MRQARSLIGLIFWGVIVLSAVWITVVTVTWLAIWLVAIWNALSQVPLLVGGLLGLGAGTWLSSRSAGGPLGILKLRREVRELRERNDWLEDRNREVERVLDRVVHA